MVTALVSGLIAAVVSIVCNALITKLLKNPVEKFCQILGMRNNGLESGQMRGV